MAQSFALSWNTTCLKPLLEQSFYFFGGVHGDQTETCFSFGFLIRYFGFNLLNPFEKSDFSTQHVKRCSVFFFYFCHFFIDDGATAVVILLVF